LEYGRGPEKVWVYGALRVKDGQALTLTSGSRNTTGYIKLLETLLQANPEGQLNLITDNLTSHKSQGTQSWLIDHPRITQTFIPKGACWLNLQEAWWRLFRRDALAGQNFVDDKEIALATEVATQQLNCRAKSWVWGRPPPSPRHYKRVFVYRL
jgi:transposase